MAGEIFEGVTFEKRSFFEIPLERGEYENCIFQKCDFSSCDLSGFNFLDCRFEDCNLSLAKVSKTVFREVELINCKLVGLRFDLCNSFLFSAKFHKCNLELSSFHKLNLKKFTFNACQLKETDFADCDLTMAIFDRCDLQMAKFENTILEKADFRTSYNFSIDPEQNSIKRARFSAEGLSGLLEKYNLEIS